MPMQTLIATIGRGLARATRDAAGQWTVEQLLGGRRVNCLVADRHRPEVVMLGCWGRGSGVLVTEV